MAQVLDAISLFQHQGSIATSCSTGMKRRVACEMGGWLLQLFPGAAHGPLLGLTGLGVAGLLFLGAVWLLKPLVAAAIAEEERRSDSPRAR